MLAVALGAALACGEVPEPGTGELAEVAVGAPNAAPEIVEQLRRDVATARHPSDGKGAVRLDGASEPPAPRVGERATYRFVFTAGPDGIAVGGRIWFQVPPYWGWSTPQARAKNRVGYTTASTDGPSRLVAAAIDAQRLEIRVEEAPLPPGGTVRIVYGAGPARVRVDRFAEEASHFVFAVDGDGDGVAGFLADRPRVAIAPGPPAALALFAPSVLRPGESGALRVSLLDVSGSPTPAEARTEVTLRFPEPFEGPASVALDPGAHSISVPFRARAGFHDAVGAVSAETAGGREGAANPTLVSADAPRFLWADLHGHSELSDGSGTPEAYFRFARQVAGLDVVALTDHDHWGFPALDVDPEAWARIARATEAAHEPGVFVTLPGFEWTSWIHGHRHVLHFGAGEGGLPPRFALRSSFDLATDTPQELWSALDPELDLTIAHHSAGDPIATDWSVPPDPRFEPVTEIASVHGSSESFDAPQPVSGMIEGNTVRDALARGYRLGFVGSGDTHDGHPGGWRPGQPTSGLAALLTKDGVRTRAAVLEALRARRSYATNGPRIVLDVRCNGAAMGALLEPGAERAVEIRAVGTAAIHRVDLVFADGAVRPIDAGGERIASYDLTLGPARAGDWFYVRVVQQDGGAAWSSPFFFDAELPR